MYFLVLIRIPSLKEIIDVREDTGSVHDFRLFKNTIGDKLDQSIGVEADRGYLGIETLQPNSRIPKKPGKNHKLTRREKAYNTLLSRKRTNIEHSNARIKTVKIMAYPYRNHLHRYLVRMTLICGIINYKLQPKDGCPRASGKFQR
jgi:hypothetical protein